MSSTSCEDELPKNDDCDKAWTCSVCMEVRERPKLLPCSHSFCQPCLEGLAESHPFGKFPCPVCREIIQLPAGGVAAFKVNFYIEGGAERVRFRCPKEHSRPRELELYCQDCCTCICLECKLHGHLNHSTEPVQSFQAFVKRKRAGLAAEADAMDGKVASVEREQQQLVQERQSLKDKSEAVRREVHRRHWLMVRMANRCRDEALSSLDDVTACIDRKLVEQVAALDKLWDDLRELQGRMKRCAESEEGIGLLETAGDTRKNVSCLEDALQKTLRTSMSRPVISFTASADVAFQSQQQFLGPVVRMDVTPERQAGFSVEQVFRCRSGDTSTEVFSLFPKARDVWICYEPCNHEKSRCPERLDFSGQPLGERKSITGRATLMQTDSGLNLYDGAEKSGLFCSLAKSRKLFKLENSLKGVACLIALKVRGGKPPTIFKDKLFTLHCGPHRGFDVNATGDIVAVVEESAATTSDWQRRVRLYRSPEPAPIDTYAPPSPGIFQPADVCFCTLRGREVLLVADELGDSVHVLRVEGSRVVFSHHLAAGHPRLVQPTAMNVDAQGGVWLACRGGAVLRLRPSAQGDSSG